jgi:hypothetical protein
MSSSGKASAVSARIITSAWKRSLPSSSPKSSWVNTHFCGPLAACVTVFPASDIATGTDFHQVVDRAFGERGLARFPSVLPA